MEENEVAAVKKSRGVLFYLKVFLVFVVMLGASMVIGIYYVYHRLTTDSRLEKLIGEKISSAISMDVKFAGVEMAFPSFTIKNLRIATDSPDLKLDANIAVLNVTPDFFAALQGELVLDSVNIASGVTILEIAGATPGADAAGAPGKQPFDLSSVKLPFRNVSLSDFRVSVRQGAAPPHELVLKNVSLSRSMLSSTIPFNVSADLVSVAGIEMDGSIQWPTTVSASIKLAGQDIEKLKKLVPIEFQKHLALVKSANVKADVEYNLADGSLKISGCQVVVAPLLSADIGIDIASISPFNATATFKLAPVQVDAVWPLVKEFVPAEHGLLIKNGVISAEGSLSLVNSVPAAMNISVVPEKITVTAKALPEAIQLDRGQIRYKDDKISLSGVSAKISDSQLQLTSGSLSIKPLEFAGDIIVDANFDSIWKMAASFLSEDARRVVPSGMAAFKGKVFYDSKGPRLEGLFESGRVSLKENRSAAQATIEKIRIRLENLGASKGKIHIESLEAKGVGASVKVKGVLTNATDIGFDLSADGNINIEEFAKIGAGLFKLPISPEQFKGDLTMAMQIGGKLSELKPKGRLEFKNVHVNMSERGFVLTRLNGAASADLDKLLLEKVSAEVLGGKVAISGSLKDFKKPVVDATLGITGADLGQIRNLLRKNVPDMPDNIEFSGKSDLNLQVKGDLAKPDINGEATLAGVEFFHPAVFRPVKNITGPIKISSNGLTTSGVKVSWGSSKATISGGLKDWAKLVSDFKFDVNPLDVTDAAGFFLKETGYSVTGSGTGNGAITGALEKIKVAGVASMPNGLVTAPVSARGDVYTFPFQKLKANFLYTELVFSITSAELDIFRGKVNASGKVYLASEPIRFEFDSKLGNLMTQDFLKQNTKYPDALTGAVNGSFAGRGNTVGLAALSGDATLAMPKGAYKSPPVLKQISEKLNVPQLASGPIDNLTGDYKIANGRISSNNVLAKAGEERVTFVGSVGLDTTLDGEARFQLSRATVLRSNVLREIIGDEATLEIPVSIKGSLMSPSVGIPLDRMLQDAAQRRAKSAVKKEAGKVLNRLFGGGKQQPAAQTATATAPVAPVSGTATATAQPVKQSPQQKIESQIKDLGKDLKNIFRR